MGGYLLLMKLWILSGNYLFSLVHVSGVFCGLWSMDRALCMQKGDIFKKLVLDSYEIREATLEINILVC